MTKNQTSKIYKICPIDLWHDAEKQGRFGGAGIDLQDGYIHFSTFAQSAETLALHFTGQTDLYLIEVDTQQLDIIWEESRGGQLFPHLYDTLPLSSVTQKWALSVDEHGIHQLPNL